MGGKNAFKYIWLATVDFFVWYFVKGIVKAWLIFDVFDKIDNLDGLRLAMRRTLTDRLRVEAMRCFLYQI